MYVCVYIEIHTYINIYIHTYIHTYIHSFIHSCIHTYIHAYKSNFRLCGCMTSVTVKHSIIRLAQEVATELVVYARLFLSALNAAIDDGLTDLPIVLP